MLLRYRESKRCGLSMFPATSAADISNAQLWLLHWLQVYDWVFTMPEKERPSFSVIYDDIKFDAWYKHYSAQRSRMERTGSSSSGAASHSNVINNF